MACKDCAPERNNPCPDYPNANCIVYSGANLTCLGVKTNDRLSVILAKIDEAVCSISPEVEITMSNLGAGEGIYAQTVGSDYQFKSLVSGTGINITSDFEQITINLDESYLNSNYWSLTGNSGTSPSTNFLGTTDAKDLHFRTNGEIAGYIGNNDPLPPLYTSGTTPHPNVAYGSHAGENAFINQEKTSNTFIGSYAGRFTRSGANVFIGDHAALMHTFGGPFGGRNVAIGHWAMNWGYRAYDNTGVGTFVFNQLWDGVSNAGFGRDVFKSATHGNGNSGFGAYAGLFNSTGIIGATITNPGSGYTTATVVISPPNFDQNYGECGEQATGTAIISDGQIVGITITNPGCGYVKFVSDSIDQLGYNTTFYGPTITITGDGSGATATPVFSYAENNTYVGSFSGLYRRYSQYETAIGHLAAGGSRWKDTSNTFLGHLSDVDASVPVTTSVNYSTAVGYNAKVGASNVIVLGATGLNQPNVGIGTIAPTKLLDVRGDILVNDLTIGRGGGNSNTNVVFGNDLPTLVKGTYNVIIGRSALKGGGGDTTGSNTAIGGQSLYSLSTNGYGNVAVGTNAFYLHNNAATNLGFNTGVGYLAGFNTTSGEFNSFFGQAAGSNNSSGSHNTAIGYKSAGSVLPLATSYAHNYNTSVGSLSSYSIRTGSYNTTIGYAAGYSITTGNYNVIIGGHTGASIATLNNNILLADGQGNLRLSFDNTGVGYLQTVNNDNTEDKLLTWNSTSKEIEYRDVSTIAVAETDPVFLASAAAGITGTDITNWNTAFGWGNHASAGYALDANVVHLTGNESIDGTKTFTSDIIIPDEAYGVGWNGSLEAPTKNAIYDKIESISIGAAGSDKQVQYNSSGSFAGAAGVEIGNTNNRLLVQSQATTEIPLIVKMIAAQTAEPIDVQNSTGNSVFRINTSGYPVFYNGAGTKTAEFRYNSGVNAEWFSTGGLGIESWGNVRLKGSTLPMVGKMGIAFSGAYPSPTALLHLAAGTAAATTAPLKFTAGINMSSPEAGAVEFDGTNLFYTTSTPARKTIANLNDVQTFASDISVPDDAYDATSWNGNFEVPTKNAIRDKIESLSSSGEANTASNVGTGADVFKQKTGVDLEFRTITEGTGIGITENTNDVEVKIKGFNDFDTASVQTTNATPTTIYTFTPTAYSRGIFEVTMVSVNTLAAEGLSGKKLVHFSHDGTNTTILASTDVETDYIDAGVSTITWSISAAGGTLVVEVTGEAGKTIDWSMNYSSKYLIFTP